LAGRIPAKRQIKEYKAKVPPANNALLFQLQPVMLTYTHLVVVKRMIDERR